MKDFTKLSESVKKELSEIFLRNIEGDAPLYRESNLKNALKYIIEGQFTNSDDHDELMWKSISREEDLSNDFIEYFEEFLDMNILNERGLPIEEEIIYHEPIKNRFEILDWDPEEVEERFELKLSYEKEYHNNEQNRLEILDL